MPNLIIPPERARSLIDEFHNNWVVLDDPPLGDVFLAMIRLQEIAPDLILAATERGIPMDSQTLTKLSLGSVESADWLWAQSFFMRLIAFCRIEEKGKPDAGKTPDQEPAVKPNGRAGGRPPISETEAAKRLDLIAKWEWARDAGQDMKTFCQDQGITVRYLETCWNWKATRDRRDRRGRQT